MDSGWRGAGHDHLAESKGTAATPGSDSIASHRGGLAQRRLFRLTRWRHSPAGGTGRSHVVHEFVDWLLPGPRDAAEQCPLNLVISEIGVSVALHPTERSSRLATAKIAPTHRAGDTT